MFLGEHWEPPGTYRHREVLARRLTMRNGPDHLIAAKQREDTADRCSVYCIGPADAIIDAVRDRRSTPFLVVDLTGMQVPEFHTKRVPTAGGGDARAARMRRDPLDVRKRAALLTLDRSHAYSSSYGRSARSGAGRHRRRGVRVVPTPVGLEDPPAR